MQDLYAKRCFKLIDEYAPGFSSSIIGYDMLTPPDLEKEIGLTGKSPIWKLPGRFFFNAEFSSEKAQLWILVLNFIHASAETWVFSPVTGGNIFHGAMGLDSLFLMRPLKGW